MDEYQPPTYSLEEILTDTVQFEPHLAQPIGKNKQKILNRVFAKKRRQAENQTRAKRKANYVWLQDRDPEAYAANNAARAAKAEARVTKRVEDGKTPYPRHFDRQFAADAMRLARAQEERNELLRKEILGGVEMEVKH